jgi:3-keto-L-gulonate-6-phosphate decarboxylase
MRVTYYEKDPWEYFIYKFAKTIKEGVEVKISYDGIEAGISLDEKALEKLATLFEKGVPLEIALGIDLPKILSSLKGERLDIVIKTKGSECHIKLMGEVLEEFRNVMQHNPIDGETLQMLGRLLKELVS